MAYMEKSGSEIMPLQPTFPLDLEIQLFIWAQHGHMKVRKE
jgi:hypothetical protein